MFEIIATHTLAFVLGVMFAPVIKRLLFGLEQSTKRRAD